jgi:5-methylcytosine-specific restriction endonuclease McrBC regulatory subunit McrC
MILVRVAALLDSLNRKFEMVKMNLQSPRGKVDWGEYARRSLPNANFLSLPCGFPDLQQDRFLQGAIRYTLEQQIQSLHSQRQHGAFIHRLIEFAQSLLQRVLSVPVHIPTKLNLQTWMQRPMRSDKFLDGLQAIEWTVEERGLAGLSDLQGLPWRMPMDQFFEAWVETIFTAVARKTGAQLKTGRQRQTTHPIDWQPSYLGSQKSLVPDILLEWDSTTLIVDAKYKRHWEELNQHSWSKVEDQLRENHRTDLFQVLAYANLAKTQSVIACMAYPCSHQTWKALEQSGRLIHKATIAIGTRAVHLWLTAVPMLADTESIASLFSDSVRSVLAA